MPVGPVTRPVSFRRVGTEKRDRQRANRALKEQQAARQQTRQRGTRIAVIVGGAIVAVLAIAFVANTFFSDDDGGTATGDTLPEVTTPGDGSVFEPTGEVVPEGCPSPDGTDTQTQSFDEAPPMCLDPAKSYSAVFTTNKGEFTLALDQEKAPLAANNLVFLARNRYYDDTICHRIIPDFVIQCGDPEGTGAGGPGY